MVMIDHAIGNQMIDVIQTAVTVDMCQDEKNDYGDKVYETTCQLAATKLVLLGPDSIVDHQAMSAPMRHSGCMVGPCGRCYPPQ